MDLNIRWKQVLFIGAASALALSMITYWVMPRVGCVDKLEDLHQLGLENLANASAAPVMVDAY